MVKLKTPVSRRGKPRDAGFFRFSHPLHAMETLTVIREFLHDRLEVDPAAIQPETTLEELKIDSLLLVELIFECEEKFNVIFERDVPTPKNIGELITIVDTFIAEARSAKQG